MNKEINWFVKPLDSHTNKVVYEHLNGAEAVYIRVKTGSVLAFSVDYPVINQMKKNRKNLKLNFDVYKRQGQGLAYKFDFNHLKSKTKKRASK